MSIKPVELIWTKYESGDQLKQYVCLKLRTAQASFFRGSKKLYSLRCMASFLCLHLGTLLYEATLL